MTSITYVLGNNLYVNMTNRCSNACEFCIRESQSFVGDSKSLWFEKEPSKEEILESILQRDLQRFSELVFCGFGEPFYRLEDMLYIIKEIKKTSEIRIRINTNGQGDLINGVPTAPLLKGLVDVLSISLNMPTQKEYDQICHSVFGEEAFDGILSFATEAKNYVNEVVFSVVDSIGSEKIEECRKIADTCGVSLRVRNLIE